MANNAFPMESAPPAPGGTQNVRILRSAADGRQVARDDRVAVEAALERIAHRMLVQRDWGGERRQLAGTAAE